MKAAATGAPFLEYNPDALQFASGETITGGTSGATAVASSNAYQDPNASLAFWGFGSSRRHKVTGARGKSKVALKNGEPGLWTFDFMGAYAGVDDTAPYAGVIYETTVPPVFLDAALTFGGYAARIASLDIDFGQTVAPVPDANAASGLIAHEITNREITARFDPQAVRTTVQDWWTKWLAATEVALSFRLGTVAGNAWEFYGKGVQVEKVDEAEREGIDADEIALSFNLDRYEPGDDDVAILAL